MQVLGTFQSRDVADSVKDALMAEGFDAGSLVVMVNRDTADPPEDAQLEVGTKGEGGFTELEEKVGKKVLSMIGKPVRMEGDGSEGKGKEGALLGVTVATQEQAEHVMGLLQRHGASDLEMAQPD